MEAEGAPPLADEPDRQGAGSLVEEIASASVNYIAGRPAMEEAAS